MRLHILTWLKFPVGLHLSWYLNSRSRWCGTQARPYLTKLYKEAASEDRIYASRGPPYIHVYIYRLDHRVKGRRAPRRSPSNPSRQQRPNIAQPIWELMNQLRVIGPPPSTNDCLGFLRSFKNLHHSNNALNYGHCSALNRLRGASVPVPPQNRRTTCLLFISTVPITNVAIRSTTRAEFLKLFWLSFQNIRPSAKYDSATSWNISPRFLSHSFDLLRANNFGQSSAIINFLLINSLSI